MTDDRLSMMPIYIGVGGEANQGLCSGSENYWCVSSQASDDAEGHRGLHLLVRHL